MNPTISFSERLNIHKAWKYLSEHTSPILVPGFQGFALLILSIIPFLAFNWLQQPFDSYMVNATEYTNQSPLGNPFFELDDAPRITVYTIIAYIFIPYLVGWIYMGCSIWIYLSGRIDTARRVFMVLCSAAAICSAALLYQSTSGFLTTLWTISLALVGGTLIDFALIFPGNKYWMERFQQLRWIGYIPPLIFAISGLILISDTTSSPIIISLWRLEFYYVCLGISIYIILLTLHILKTNSQLVRQQARQSMLGILISVVPILVWSALSWVSPKVQFSPFILPSLAIFPTLTVNALHRKQYQNSDAILRKTITYTMLSGLVTISYIFLTTGASLIAGEAIPGNHPLLMGLVIFILAVSLNPLRNHLQKLIDTKFFKGKQSYHQQLQSFAHELTRDVDVNMIIESMQKLVTRALSPSLVHIYSFESKSNHYVAVSKDNGHFTSDLRFHADDPFVQFLASRNTSFQFSERESLPDSLLMEKNRLAMLGANLFVPLPGQKKPVGWLALGPPISHNEYNKQNIAFLESICDQAALAIERSQVISNLERRVREMDVLTRIAQGVNITLEFDDILELIYTQTNLVIPTVDFRITLLNPTDGKYYHAFFLEDDERLAHNENITIPIKQGLEVSLIQNQRALVTSDYEMECRRHGVIPNATGILAWIGVSLNAGSEAIGAISLGTRDPSTVYTEQQRDLLQAIADQAAGAIVKSQLLLESEKRARQLAKLNEVGRSLTSTLELNPLLTQIMNSAIEILNCEAGNLIMVDTNTLELIVEVAVGPVASDLAGTRFSKSTGVAGQVADTGQPMIANNAATSDYLLDEADLQTGFLTRNLLAVPIKVKETTIGVIEVINKLDGSPFTADDLGILSTFTSQAAIAMENARLYTQTDEALSARLDEMSVMQRIDRELNTSLDVDRTMRITLDWSRNYSNAEAGIIGFVEGSDRTDKHMIRVIASEGFQEDQLIDSSRGKETDSKNGVDIVSLKTLHRAIREGQPIYTHIQNGHISSGDRDELISSATGESSSDMFLLNQSKSQIIIPIRRKTDVIGFLLLESSDEDKFTSDAITFLTRLSDHAAIAISNALLYADLQAANIAKSEFVSLVSHELKTPMTSIRGYSDLLAQETVGPINETQSNFLNTIRANVNRMANLVSDLADVSRIEAGRMRLEFSSLAISDILEEVFSSVNAQLTEKEHTLNLTTPENLPNVWGDYNRLIQVMNNLLSNAIKYTPQHGKIEIICEVTDNTKGTHGAPQVVHVSVADSGHGISIEDQTRIFQKFFRSNDQNIRDVPGTGLGLNITRHLVEMQGGRIWFESEHGKGSIFHFSIPVAATD